MLKEKIYSACEKLLNEKIEELNLILSELTAGTENDSKSSAGDKHETSRAMMQAEYEKVGRQLGELLVQRDALGKIDIRIRSSGIIRGSLVKTDKSYLFLSVPLGRLVIDEVEVVTLSPQSPLGQKLMGLKADEAAEINGIKYRVEEVS